MARLTTASYGGSDVQYVGRNGRSRVLWANPFQVLSEPMVSPDGRHVAFGSLMIEGSVWMLQGF